MKWTEHHDVALDLWMLDLKCTDALIRKQLKRKLQRLELDPEEIESERLLFVAGQSERLTGLLPKPWPPVEVIPTVAKEDVEKATVDAVQNPPTVPEPEVSPPLPPTSAPSNGEVIPVAEVAPPLEPKPESKPARMDPKLEPKPKMELPPKPTRKESKPPAPVAKQPVKAPSDVPVAHPTLPDMNSVKSSTLVSLGYSDHILFVEFDEGPVYYYKDVPESIFDLLMQTDAANRLDNAGISLGKLFHHLVRAHPEIYPFRKWRS